MSYDRQSRPLLAACSSEWPVPHMFSHCLLGGGSGGFRLWATQPVLLGIYLCMLLFQRMCSQLGILGSKCLQSFNHQIAFRRGATDVHSLRVRGPRLGGALYAHGARATRQLCASLPVPRPLARAESCVRVVGPRVGTATEGSSSVAARLLGLLLLLKFAVISPEGLRSL